MALSCKEIVMGKHSSLGPIDPQFRGIAAQEIVKEWEQAKEEIRQDQRVASAWQPILSKYHPTFVAQCKHAITWSEQLANEWLSTNMLKAEKSKVDSVVRAFSDSTTNLSHSRHIPSDKCKDVGLNISNLEDDQSVQDCILSLHHTYMLTFLHSNAIKIVENHTGVMYVESVPGAAD